MWNCKFDSESREDLFSGALHIYTVDSYDVKLVDNLIIMMQHN